MLQNYIKIAWRNLWKNKTFSSINIFGLAIGIAGALLIGFHIRHELSYDKGFSKADRIYRITFESTGADSRHWAATPPPLGPALHQQFPQIEQSVRLHRLFPYQLLSHTGPKGEVKRFEEKGGLFANADVITMFDLAFVSGNAKTALTEANAIVVTEEMAAKYFGKTDPLGKIIIDDRNKLPLKVTGVIKAFDFPTHLHFDYLVSIPTIDRYLDKRSMENIDWSGFYHYVMLRKDASKEKLEAGFPSFATKFYAPLGESESQILATRHLHLQPIKDIHLHSKLEKDMSTNSDITYVYIFAMAALFILLVATINFINISTALAFNRMKEIGLRKVVGATRTQLIRQFLSESFIVTLLASSLSALLFKLSIPFYTNLAGEGFAFSDVLTLPNLATLVLLMLIVAFFAGLYPAWFVARFNPVVSLKGKRMLGQSVNIVRKGLIVFQFVVSVFMIFSTIIVYRQMQLFHNRNLGFDKDQVISITMYNQMWEKFGALTDQMTKNPAIAAFATTSTLPGERFGSYPASPLHRATGESIPDGSRVLWSDEKLFSALGVKLKEGRAFYKQFPKIDNPEFILNEAAVKSYRLKNPVGETFVVGADTGTVVGVVKDFNFASLHSKVEPLVIQYNPYWANYMLVKVRGDQVSQTLEFLKKQVNTLSPSSKFTYSFLDENLEKLYASENRMGQVFNGFAGLAILISCLGLFGLSAYSAKLRTKEVGVRKVLGASVGSVTFLLSKDFILLVAVAVVISLPVAWWVMEKWLDSFAYRISVSWDVFLLAGISAMLLALVTISFQSVKTALINPVKNLKVD
ncbi:ABC transporter permease [Dyadobacter sp. LJ53]|uniref:ABC transporter permease n=1 Tax=Dyadobacter chenwenxiniae TaxID=2906456 RepID=UPI001F427AA8|nr:ABC transporter permease [Dyadobacter chenwenxiniae]MCF0050399.1 ABC transporter permease [Dyadobacter chenwenxiniae]